MHRLHAGTAGAAEKRRAPTSVDINKALREQCKKLKRKAAQTEKAAELFTQQVTAKEYAHVLKMREYNAIVKAAGQIDFIPDVLEAVVDRNIAPDHIWYLYNRFAWANCTCSHVYMFACVRAFTLTCDPLLTLFSVCECVRACVSV
jgi:hypothetical protein